MYGRPILTNNVETLANVPHIATHGADWHRSLGVGHAAGPKIYRLTGDAVAPGVYELPMATSLRDLIEFFGRAMLSGKQFKAVFAGGASNTILKKKDIDVALDFDSAWERRSSLGTGAMIVTSEGTGIVKRVTDYVSFFAHSPCGQRPPCKIGTCQLWRLLQKIDVGKGTHADLDALINLCGVLPGSGRCALIDGAVTVVNSSLDKFRAEYERQLIA